MAKRPRCLSFYQFSIPSSRTTIPSLLGKSFANYLSNVEVQYYGLDKTKLFVQLSILISIITTNECQSTSFINLWSLLLSMYYQMYTGLRLVIYKPLNNHHNANVGIGN